MNEGDLLWELEQYRQLRGACSCGDSTLLGVIHSDTRPCSLPVVYMPLTDDQIMNIGVEYADMGGDISNKSWADFGRAIEKAHGIRGIYEV
jgi:hypothetical protein